ncbi:MAG: O-antigen ligase family protein [Caldilineaceae bacterium]
MHRFRWLARPWAWLIAGLLLLSFGSLLYWQAHALAQNCSDCTWLPLKTATTLVPGGAAAMDSPFFTYSPGWTVTPQGADPAEPPDPLAEPAGTVAFTYPGGDLYLLLAPGDYWAYLYATVDGRPANRLPVIPGNLDSQGQPAGYKPLLAPERSSAGDSSEPRWLLVHHGDAGKTQNVLLELWRGWGQVPLRGVAVDLPPGARLEPNGPSVAQLAVRRGPPVLVMILGLWSLGIGAWVWAANRAKKKAGEAQTSRTSAAWARLQTLAPPAAGAGVLLTAAGLALHIWVLCPLGLALVALAGIVRPALWLSALLFGLPFAYGLKLPILPARSLDLIDIGTWGGLVVLIGHLVLRQVLLGAAYSPRAGSRNTRLPALVAFAAVTSWALVAAVDAYYPDLALREWRVVFLNGLVFGGVLMFTLAISSAPAADRWLLVAAWLCGAALVALFGLWGYAAGNAWVSQAEGVRRVQAFYDSANNLALYLDRTLAVSLALVLFARGSRQRLLWALLTAPQALVWLLTFSKGSLVLAGPAMALVLLFGGAWLLRKQGRSLRPLWILLVLALLAVLAVTPFLGAERFQRLFDLGQGTGFLRLQLWRSALQMGLDHPLFGVGPDNFLYAYRSGHLLPSAWQEPNLNHPHNLLLDWWTRLGIPGLLLGLAWLGLGTWSVLRWLRRGPTRALALGVLAAIAAGLAHGLIDVSYALPDLMIVWMLLFGLAPESHTAQEAALNK